MTPCHITIAVFCYSNFLPSKRLFTIQNLIELFQFGLEDDPDHVV